MPFTFIVKKRQVVPEIVTSGKEARLTTRDGSAITVSLEGRESHVLAALATELGQFCAFPDGEVAIAPVEGSAKGTLVNPFSIEKAEIGFLKENLSMKVKDGKVIEIEGGMVADVIACIGSIDIVLGEVDR